MEINQAKKIIKETRFSYNTIAECFNQTRQYLWQEFDDFKKYFNNKDKVLDFGCGNGRFYDLIKDLEPEYYGVDLSSSLLSLAQQKIPRGHFYEIDENLNLSFANNYFDVIVCLATFHHIPSKELQFQLLKEFFRVLKPQGILIMSVWDFYHGKNCHYLWQHYFYCLKQVILLSKNKCLGFKDLYLPWKDDQGRILVQRYFHAFTRKELNNLLKSAGFRIKFAQLRPHNNRREYFNLITIAQK